MRPLRRLAAALVVAAVGTAAAAPVSSPASSPGPTGPAPGPDQLAAELVSAVSATGALRHLTGLAAVAERSGGTRAAGTAGYDASVDLVVTALRAAGFDVATPEFHFPEEEVLARRLAVSGVEVEVDRLTGSPDTPAGGVRGPLVVVPDERAPVCRDADLDGLPVAGAVLVVRRGGCTFARKAARAAEAGAAALVVVNDRGGRLRGGTLGAEGPLPVVGVSREEGARLSGRAGAPATLDVRAVTRTRTSRNVVAQTRTGRTDDVVVLGAHLDSVAEGPGVDDNGSGSAALLELATALGSAPDVGRAVRFAWWGAEEVGLLGSRAYVDGLTRAERRDLGLYLNVDMIASPNPGYFVYDGDDSARRGAGPGPAGSAGIEDTLTGYLRSRGVEPDPTDLDARSDHGPFVAAGVPSGGLFSGAEGAKSAEQAARWGGAAGQPFDPCYHRACDDLTNLDRRALDLHLDALAWATGHYAGRGPAGPGPCSGPRTPAAPRPAPGRRPARRARPPPTARMSGAAAPASR